MFHELRVPLEAIVRQCSALAQGSDDRTVQAVAEIERTARAGLQRINDSLPMPPGIADQAASRFLMEP